jgi:hypothetical protein
MDVMDHTLTMRQDGKGINGINYLMPDIISLAACTQFSKVQGIPLR